ncbi:MAG: transposase [Raineya sp.]|nr:transposase [Raineya sp.]MDW8297609.1 transposase [Raineya sp.]
MRAIVEVILYLNYTGVQWRNLTYRNIAWQTVYYHFRQFKRRVFGNKSWIVWW